MPGHEIPSPDMLPDVTAATDPTQAYFPNPDRSLNRLDLVAHVSSRRSALEGSANTPSARCSDPDGIPQAAEMLGMASSQPSPFDRPPDRPDVADHHSARYSPPEGTPGNCLDPGALPEAPGVLSVASDPHPPSADLQTEQRSPTTSLLDALLPRQPRERSQHNGLTPTQPQRLQRC